MVHFCVRSYEFQYYRHFYFMKNLFFASIIARFGKPENLRKVRKPENLYEILGSRAVVKFRINSGFFSPRFFETLLIAFAKIKDFYVKITAFLDRKVFFFATLQRLNKNSISDFTNPVLYCIMEVYVTFGSFTIERSHL